MSTNNLKEENVKKFTTRKDRVAAVLEICGVYMAGLLIAYILIQLSGIEISNPLEVLAENPDADMLKMSVNMALLLLFQYGSIMLIAFVIGWWHRRRKLSGYGFALTKKPFMHHLWIGIVLFAVAALPFKFLTLIDHFISLGAKATTQEIVYTLDWSSFGFWVFMAVGSFLLIPIVEEFFFRGYVQTRLAEDFDAPTAIIIAALFFSFVHGQYYLTVSTWTVSMSIALLFSSFVWGYVFYRTKSLISPIVAHALINFPVRGIIDFVLPVLMVAIILVYRKKIIEYFHAFRKLFKSEIISKITTTVVGILVSFFAILIVIAQDIALLLGLIALIVAIILEFVEKRKLKRIGPDGAR
jgi:uncharacterized protein